MIREKKGIGMIAAIILAVIFTAAALHFTASEAHAGTYTGKYWLKVNEQQNVVTAYKKVDGKWKPIRAMLCSTGLNGTTPRGTFYTQGRWNWGELMNDVYGQYCTHITSDILFHSVYYTERFDRASQVTSQFNMLGRAASHGCVRLSVVDAKWIYYTCKIGTKVTIYRSDNPGPLGKPSPTKVYAGRYKYWDPTDPDPANPYYIIDPPTIRVSPKKPLTVQYGKKNYNLKSYVYAKDPNTFMNLKDDIKVSRVERYSSKKGGYVKEKFSINKLGTYKVTYKVTAPYGKSASTTVKIKVVDNLKAPVISGAKNRTVTWGDKNAVKGVTAKQASASRTSAIKVYIKAPGAEKYKIYSYKDAKNYRFAKTGKYSIKYIVKNKYAPYKEAKKIITITSKKGAVNKDPQLNLPAELEAALLGADGSCTAPLAVQPGVQTDLITGVSAVHNGKDATSKLQIAIKGPSDTDFQSVTAKEAAAWIFESEGEYQIKYSVKNAYTPYQTVSKIVLVKTETAL